MPPITYEAIVKNGSIKLNTSVQLPENATVYVVVPDTTVKQIVSPRLVNQQDAADFEKIVTMEQRATESGYLSRPR